MEKNPKSNTRPLWSWSQDSFWVRSSAAMVTWTASRTLQLSISTAAKCHRILQSSRNRADFAQNWADFGHGPPEAAQVPSPHGHEQTLPRRRGRTPAEPWEPHWLWMCHHSPWHPGWNHAAPVGEQWFQQPLTHLHALQVGSQPPCHIPAVLIIQTTLPWN